MGIFDHFKESHTELSDAPHKAKLSHELIAGAAAYEAEKAYAKHCKENGKPQSHERAKELMAGFAGAFIDRMVETKGLDYVDKEKAKHDAKKHVEVVATEAYTTY